MTLEALSWIEAARPHTPCLIMDVGFPVWTALSDGWLPVYDVMQGRGGVRGWRGNPQATARG